MFKGDDDDRLATTESISETVLTTPENIQFVEKEKGILTLYWDPSDADIGVIRYEIYRDGDFIDFAKIPTYKDASIQSSTRYCYKIVAVDVDENLSEQDNEACYTTTAFVFDTEQPTTPTDFYAIATSSSEIFVNWQASSDNIGVAKYQLYRIQGEEMSAFQTIYSTGLTLLGLDDATPYCFAVAALDADNNISELSNEACATTFTTASSTIEFSGGTLDDLMALGPNLVFDELNINGPLTIPAGLPLVTLTANKLTINASISPAHPACAPYYDTSSLLLSVLNSVSVNAPIDLSGLGEQVGKADPACNTCYAQNGGDITIGSHSIIVNETIDTSGGSGCKGGDAGDIVLVGLDKLDIGTTARSILDAGKGSNPDSLLFGDGQEGILDWVSSTIEIQEYIPNLGENNLLRYNAQLLDEEAWVLHGNTRLNEESSHRLFSSRIRIDLGNNKYDIVEDLFLLDHKQSGPISLSLIAENQSADLDLYVINEDASLYVAHSNGPSANESLTSPLLEAGKYYIGVSYSDDGPDYTTDYTLKLIK